MPHGLLLGAKSINSKCDRLLYRAWQVLRIPVPELIDLLGLEVPSVPEVSLAGIEADSITLHWIGRDRQSTIVKHLIKVNGITGMTPSSSVPHISPNVGAC